MYEKGRTTKQALTIAILVHQSIRFVDDTNLIGNGLVREQRHLRDPVIAHDAITIDDAQSLRAAAEVCDPTHEIVTNILASISYKRLV